MKCPQCGARINFFSMLGLDDIVVCRNCGTTLEIIGSKKFGVALFVLSFFPVMIFASVNSPVLLVGVPVFFLALGYFLSKSFLRLQIKK